MNSDNATPTIEEGDKIEIDGEDGVFVVTWAGISTKAEPVDGSWTDAVKLDDDDVAERVTILSDDQPITAAGREISEHIDIEALSDALEGRHGLRTSKPDADGLTQYVWRRARFHSGADDSMPVMSNSWLQAYLDEQGIDASVTGVLDDAGKEVTSQLEKAVDAVLVSYDLNPAEAARRYQKAGAL